MNWKGKIKLSLFGDDMILYIENLKNLQNNTGTSKSVCSTDMPNKYAPLIFDKRAQAIQWRKYIAFSINGVRASEHP